MYDFWNMLTGELVLIFASIIITFLNRGRIKTLEQAAWMYRKRLDALERKVGIVTLPPDAAPKPAAFSSSTDTAQTLPLHYEASINTDPFFPWLRENWLLTIGSVFMVLAAGWLVRYSILHGFIGPVGRISLGLALGAGIMSLAVRRIQTHVNQGGIFTILGATIILLTVFTGQKLYDLFTPITSMGLMFITVALVAFISVRYRLARLSYAGLVMAGLIPFMISTGDKNFIGLFSYLAVVTAGTLWVVFLTGWRKNILIALSVVCIYSVPVLSYHTSWFDNALVGLSFAFGFGVVFFLISFAVNLQVGGRETKVEMMTAGLLGLYLMGWILIVAPNEWQSMLFAAWTLLFSVASYHLFLQTKASAFFYIYGGISAMLLVAATATEFSGPALTLAFIVESAIFPALVWKGMGEARYVVKTSFLVLLPAFLSLESLKGRWNWPQNTIIHEHFFVVLAMTLAASGVAFLLHHLKKRSSDPIPSMESAMILNLALGTFFGGSLVWMCLHAIMPTEDMARTLSLIIFMLVGLGAYIQGYLRAQRPVKLYGGIIIGWVAFRLIFIDMPDMGVGGKVVTFFVLGALLLGTAFIEHKGKKATK